MKYLLLLVVLVGCSAAPDGTSSTGSYHLERMENDEVICYGYWQKSLQCKFKK